jgi:hypothetical protein
MSIQVWHQPESGRIASKLQAVGNGERREGLGLDVPGATGATGLSALPALPALSDFATR